MTFRVSVPASSANLGPGFDSMALALALRNEVVVEPGGDPAVAVEGEGSGELPMDASNLVFRTMSYLAREVGGRLPQVSLRCLNRIPLERGLGSSAAAVVAGVLIADRLLASDLPPDRLLEVAVDVEGHPDNVAACLRGGLALAFLGRDGWRVARIDPDPSLRPVILAPDHERVATDDARRVLPREVPLVDAAFNGGRAALLVLALTGRTDLLADALDDRLHQQRRLALAPASRALFADLREAGIPVCVSGAGPSLLAFETEGKEVQPLGPGWRIERPGIDTRGAVIEEVADASGYPRSAPDPGLS